MKKFFVNINIFVVVILFAGLLSMSGCQKQQIGFMEVVNASYLPDSMYIRLTLDDELDAYRIYNVAPWVSPKLQGVIGTNVISYVVEHVVSEDGDAEMFKRLVSVRGGGRIEFPLVSDIPAGKYVVSLRVTNEGHSALLKDIFTFIVKE